MNAVELHDTFAAIRETLGALDEMQKTINRWPIEVHLIGRAIMKDAPATPISTMTLEKRYEAHPELRKLGPSTQAVVVNIFETLDGIKKSLEVAPALSKSIGTLA